jgi:hypothetical protein
MSSFGNLSYYINTPKNVSKVERVECPIVTSLTKAFLHVNRNFRVMIEHRCEGRNYMFRKKSVEERTEFFPNNEQEQQEKSKSKLKKELVGVGLFKFYF